MKTTLRIATRKSPLALWQANFIKDRLLTLWPNLHIELLPMTTSGDRFLKDKLIDEGGKGLFVKELEEALLAGQADLAVHSMKDVPTEFPQGLILAGICERESPFDVLISRDNMTLATLPDQSRIGTSSLRRQSQLLAFRPKLQVLTLRGNVQTRLAQLDAGHFDAIILAKAGLDRLGLQDRIIEVLSPEIMLPACGQGALGLECREDDHTTQALLKPLNHEMTALCVRNERLVNARLGGNCHVPLAVYCHLDANPSQLILQAKVLDAQGQTCISERLKGQTQDAVQLANTCAEQLLQHGAERLLAQGNLG